MLDSKLEFHQRVIYTVSEKTKLLVLFLQ